MGLLGRVTISEEEYERLKASLRELKAENRRAVLSESAKITTIAMQRAEISGLIATISELQESVIEQKQKYADELQKRLVLADKVAEMEARHD